MEGLARSSYFDSYVVTVRDQGLSTVLSRMSHFVVEPEVKPAGITIVCISDTHSKHRSLKIPEGDVLIHAGDFSDTGKKPDIQEFVNWFGSQPHPQKVFIGGNHDITLHTDYYVKRGAVRFHARLLKQIDTTQYSLECRKIVLENTNTTYLEDTECVLGTPTVPLGPYPPIKCYGSPWSPEFCDWGFNAQRGEELKKKWEMIPQEVDVLITHGPPYGYGM